MNKDCSICENKIKDKYGHNAQPINDGICCEDCNYKKVIPIRMLQMSMGHSARRTPVHQDVISHLAQNIFENHQAEKYEDV